MDMYRKSVNLYLKNIMPLTDLLDKLKVKLPELVKGAAEREKLKKIVELL